MHIHLSIAKNSKQQGFTLIEVLLAMAITVVAASIAYAGLDSAISMAEASKRHADDLQRFNRIFDVMAKDFRHVIPRKVRDPDGIDGFKSAFIYDAFAVPQLIFTRTGRYNPQPSRFQRSNLERVAYHFEDETLSRFSWSMVDHYGDDEPNKAVLLKKVKRFELRLLEVKPKTAGANAAPGSVKWQTSWPENNQSGTSAASSTVPIAIEILLEHENWGEVRRVFEVVDQ